MIYCGSCARILDTDVQFCPHCNEEDPNWQVPQDVPEYQEPDFIPNRVFRGEAFDRLREINQHIEDNPRVEPKKPDPPEDKPSTGLYIAMIMLATCLSFVGLIMGIIYVTNKNKNYHPLGVATLLTSIFFLIFGILFFLAIILLYQ